MTTTLNLSPLHALSKAAWACDSIAVIQADGPGLRLDAGNECDGVEQPLPKVRMGNDNDANHEVPLSAPELVRRYYHW